jgi:uncharacterized protein DUF3568
MMRVRNIFFSLMLFGIVVVNSGCVTILAAGAITGATQYVKYTVDSTAKRTFSENLNHVMRASIDVLKKMNITIDTVKKKESGAKIQAVANDLKIKISIHPITDNTTKVSIDALKYAVLRDKATADEIITQIDVALTDQRVLLGKRDS